MLGGHKIRKQIRAFNESLSAISNKSHPWMNPMSKINFPAASEFEKIGLRINHDVGRGLYQVKIRNWRSMWFIAGSFKMDDLGNATDVRWSNRRMVGDFSNRADGIPGYAIAIDAILTRDRDEYEAAQRATYGFAWTGTRSGPYEVAFDTTHSEFQKRFLVPIKPVETFETLIDWLDTNNLRYEFDFYMDYKGANPGVKVYVCHIAVGDDEYSAATGKTRLEALTKAVTKYKEMESNNE